MLMRKDTFHVQVMLSRTVPHVQNTFYNTKSTHYMYVAYDMFVVTFYYMHLMYSFLQYYNPIGKVQQCMLHWHVGVT